MGCSASAQRKRDEARAAEIAARAAKYTRPAVLAARATKNADGSLNPAQRSAVAKEDRDSLGVYSGRQSKDLSTPERTKKPSKGDDDGLALPPKRDATSNSSAVSTDVPPTETEEEPAPSREALVDKFVAKNDVDRASKNLHDLKLYGLGAANFKKADKQRRASWNPMTPTEHKREEGSLTKPGSRIEGDQPLQEALDSMDNPLQAALEAEREKFMAEQEAAAEDDDELTAAVVEDSDALRKKYEQRSADDRRSKNLHDLGQFMGGAKAVRRMSMQPRRSAAMT